MHSILVQFSAEKNIDFSMFLDSAQPLIFHCSLNIPPAAMAKKGKKGHQAAAARAAKAKAEESTAPAGDARKGVKGLLVAGKKSGPSQLKPVN